MFKKPVSDWKTSAPLKNSDRRKLRTRIVNAFSAYDTTLDTVVDTLVPDPVLHIKFATHTNIPGVAYLDKDGEPRWLTIGKGSEALIPTVYTLWKRPELLPFLSTPAAVIPVISGGADLMIPGVVQCPGGLAANTLVSITQYHGVGKRGPPVAVGRLVVPSDQIISDNAKGKAVSLMHSWKDHLWDKGSNGEIPPPVDLTQVSTQTDSEVPAQTDSSGAAPNPAYTADGDGAPVESKNGAEVTKEPDFSPEEITNMLHSSLLQAIATTLSDLPASAFPMPSTIFYTQHLLPSRPAPALNATPSVDIKHSTHKSLTAFLKTAEKEGLIKLKSSPKSTDVLVASISKTHADVQSHLKYGTAGELEAKREKRDKQTKVALENAEKESRRITVNELWKPHGNSLAWFEEGLQKDGETLFTLQELKELLDNYTTQRKAANAQDGRYLNVKTFDERLIALVLSKDTPQSTKSGRIRSENGEVEFITREDLLATLRKSMQQHYSIAHGKDETAITKKGTLQSISIVQKKRQGRKMCTLITNFELFGIDAEEMADELRKVCASSTGVSPLPGKGAGMEVLVQGQQASIVRAWLMDHGVPGTWISGGEKQNKKNK